jgi:deoxyhypusine synthase
MRKFINQTFRHFNARELRNAASAWVQHSGKMLVSMGGAMSTAEIGVSLAPLIRAGKVHAISCTGANLEEDFYNLIGASSPISDYRSLSERDEVAIQEKGGSRVTDTIIDVSIVKMVDRALLELWQSGLILYPYQYFYCLFRPLSGFTFEQERLKESWLYAAYEMQIPIFTPGWEDSSSGNFFVSKMMSGQVNPNCVRMGHDAFAQLATWYMDQDSVGFFQIGGGIAADFAICVVPMLNEDLGKGVPRWSYFCQIGDSTTSYGSYSGAPPNEKITWGKLGPETPKFMIESDATICFPLIAQYVLHE